MRVVVLGVDFRWRVPVPLVNREPLLLICYLYHTSKATARTNDQPQLSSIRTPSGQHIIKHVRSDKEQ